MNYQPANGRRLVRRYLQAAQERLESAEALLKLGNHEDVISRCYYAYLDLATACLITKDLVPKSHAGAIRLFSLHFVKPGLVERHYQRWFNALEDDRLDADYTHAREFTEQEAKEAIERTEAFLKLVRMLVAPYLKKG